MSHQNLHGEKAFDLQMMAGVRLGTAVFAAAATLTLDEDSPAAIAFDPSGAGQKVLLPLASKQNEGLVFFIVNTADAAEDLTVKDSTDTNTIVTVSQNETAWVVLVGGVWRACVGKNT
jgi:hypothetical protein